MVSTWEKNLNVSLCNTMENNIMGLANILSSINKTENTFLLNENYQTIRYIKPEEYKQSVFEYVEPKFNECSTNNSLHPRFLLFSAPGATGKTALAKYICYSKNGIYWDLPDNKVAEYSFNGAISKAVGYPNMSHFIESIINGDNFFVIDAFDEAEAGSGRTGIEFFLRDLNDVTQTSKKICAILLARTESAIFIKNYFNTNNIPYKHFEVGYFAEYNAKTYIKNGLKRINIAVTNLVSTCIDEQFKEIKRILNETDSESFLGYAPVLNALTASYDNDRNTLNLLKKIGNVDNNFELMKQILEDLLLRERGKFIKALKVKISKITTCSESIYDNNEQILRLFGMILFNDTTLFTKIDQSIPIEFNEEYLEVINTQLPQHPFIQAKEYNSNVFYDFTGTTFRDFIIAYNLSSEDTYDFVDEYLSEHNKYCPSQMLIQFYNQISDRKVRGRHIPLMYNSFKAYAKFGDEIFVHINGINNDCSIEFSLKRGKSIISKIEFDIIDLENGIYINQLSNCYIDVCGKVYIGDLSGESRIANSTINCDEIIWRNEYISIEAFSPGICELNTKKFNYITNTIPRFEIKTDNKENLKIICQSMNGYYKLLPYKYDELKQEDEDDFIRFANLIRRIFSCLRSHSKDTPARKMDFIDNRIISSNTKKEEILEFLLKKHILYTDQQNWLYKLDTNKLSDFSINWNEARDGNYNSLNNLYQKFIK
ncbi:MAG: hypothetical protein NC313_07540 [Butyrivibrio sp.]|nr:hypothetical protein [Butyrivibrio sp.]